MHTGADTTTTVHFLLCVPPVCSLYTGQTGVLIWGTWTLLGRSANPEVLHLHQTVLHSAVHQPYYPAVASRTWFSPITSWSLTNLVTLTSLYSGNHGCPLRRRSLVLGQPTSLQTLLVREKPQLFLQLKVSLLRDSTGKRQRFLPHVTL